ncbi:MAG TPA: NADH-quinone oxidoreductase subunit L [Tepidisphaeraceae bacterium]|jgi:NADH-quinone oxidoreductase subunit L
MDHLFAVQYSILIPLLPLIAACVSGFFGARYLRERSHWPIWIGVGASAILSFILLFGMLGHHNEAQLLPNASDATAHAEAGDAADGHWALSTTKVWYEWIGAGDPAKMGIAAPDTPSYFRAYAGAFFDPLSVMMLCIVTGIGFLITVFSKGYMAGEEGYFRFFAFLGLFIFAMTILVMGENLVMLYLGWEGVGLCSYLLIGYYYNRPSAAAAAKKAFIVNRIGDFGFGIGIMLTFLIFGTVSYFGGDPTHPVGFLTKAASADFISHLQPWQYKCVQWIPFCLMLGAFGKSAQFPLYVWLPDAMEGPTPVSALIHAATMVTAGVYMIARCSALFYGNAAATQTVAAIGCATALFAAIIAMRQFDLKKVFAYSTVSQLGYMFVAVGVLAPVAGAFHLLTHAFFKALLFLASGVVMHAMAGELDMRKMSGLKRVLPITHWCMLLGCAALSGFPFVSGFFSKDEIVGAAMHRLPALGILLLITSGLTAYYTFRLYFRVFQGPLVVPDEAAPAFAHGHEPHEDATASDSAVKTDTSPASGVDVGQTTHAPAHHADDHGHDEHHSHEPPSMIIPLIVLAIGAVIAGYINWPSNTLGRFLGQSPSYILGNQVAVAAGLPKVDAENFGLEPSHVEWGGLVMGGIVSILGIGIAWILHLRDRGLAAKLAQRLGPIAGLVENKFYVDEIYHALLVVPLWMIGKATDVIDWLVDQTVDLVGLAPRAAGVSLKRTIQRGYLQGYATAMLFGITVILLILFLW